MHMGRGPMVLDFGAGLIRHEATNDPDIVECDIDMLSEPGADELCETVTTIVDHGARKRPRTEMPEGPGKRWQQ